MRVVVALKRRETERKDHLNVVSPFEVNVPMVKRAKKDHKKGK